jgi:hypothetical protein
VPGGRCPYAEHAPQTAEGWQAWDVLCKCAGQLRLAPMGGAVLGLDLGAALALTAAAGYDAAAIAELLPAGEAGMIKAINDRIGRDDEWRFPQQR